MDNNTQIETWDLYDPNWEQTFDFHMDAHKALMADGEEDTGEKRVKLNEHERGFKNAHIQQFRNGSEYADYMIKFLKPKAQGHNLVWIGLDTSNIKTVEEANTLFSQVSDFLDAQIKEKYSSLPESNKMGIFAAENTKSQYASFTRLGTDTVVTVEERDNDMNICLTHLASNRGTSVINGIETLAKSIFEHSSTAKEKGLANIHWYIHVPASASMSGEKFMEVTMNYRDGRFRDTDFCHLETVPSSIKKACFNAAKYDMGLTEEEQKNLGYPKLLASALTL